VNVNEAPITINEKQTTDSGASSRSSAARPRQGRENPSSVAADLAHLPTLLTVAEVAQLLRKSLKAVYTMSERGQLPGAIRVRRQLLFSRSDLVRWLDQNRVPSPEGVRR
jgi:excisionase family DNA binding protein